MGLRHHLARLYAPLRALSPPAGLRILMLHDVPAAHRAALDRLVGWLVRRNWLVTPDQAREMILSGSYPGHPSVLLTFDDGFADNFDAAMKVLAPHGAKAVFFVCPGIMQAQDKVQAMSSGFWEGARLSPQGVMDWDQLAALKAAGHAIGNHTLDHRRLSRLSGADLDSQISQAANLLRDRLGGAVDWFAYPFGDISSIHAQALAIIGAHHPLCRSGVRGINGGHTPPLAVRADHLDLADPFAYHRAICLGMLDGRYGLARDRLDRMVA